MTVKTPAPGLAPGVRIWYSESTIDTKGGNPSCSISKDSAASHQKFAAKYNLPFLLLSDPDHAVLELYDVWKEKKNYGKVSMGTVRSTYLIGEDGTILKAMPKVKPDTNAADVLAALDALDAAGH